MYVCMYVCVLRSGTSNYVNSLVHLTIGMLANTMEMHIIQEYNHLLLNIILGALLHLFLIASLDNCLISYLVSCYLTPPSCCFDDLHL